MENTKHENKYCPRCNVIFECKVGSVNLCQCSTVQLTAEERNFLLDKFDDCLCASCMAELRSEYHREHLQKKISKILGPHGR